MTQKYRIEELFTAGWELVDSSAKSLTKEQCDERLKSLILQGYNPNLLRVRLDNTETEPYFN